MRSWTTLYSIALCVCMYLMFVTVHCELFKPQLTKAMLAALIHLQYLLLFHMLQQRVLVTDIHSCNGLQIVEHSTLGVHA